ncbi:hypothetical protein [Pseudoalteromonas luteoviolacea]|uniref:Uncharacterized protein n=1 Tax=Pseudoalteromonas luteoviolacea S4060-1 TaxID=1365257 RepID=A0A167LQK7_9GAMM|nr:hypothetical protein [Pseudoalteromonas luteoviolacea]KZN65018.1 hypothetical protein N478_03150 [Pseudoalteromonas luteoviolacea S4060-1]
MAIRYIYNVFILLFIFSFSQFANSSSALNSCKNVNKINSTLPEYIDNVTKKELKKFYKKPDVVIVAPTIAQQNKFVELLPVLNSGRCPSENEKAMANSINYEFVYMKDPSETYVSLIGLQPMYGVKDHGWGSFFYKLETEPRAVIEIVHPLNDTFTAEIGARVFVRSSAHAYFISGGYRGAKWDNSPAGTDSDVSDLGNDGKADPPDLLGSLFNKAHLYASKGPVLSLQIHAYGDKTASKFPDNKAITVVEDYNPYTKNKSKTTVRPLKAIISSGSGRINPFCLNIERVFEEKVGRAGVFFKESPQSASNHLINSVVDKKGKPLVHSGNGYRFLAAARNIHGQETRSGLPGRTGFFCHIELSRDSRSPTLNQDATVLAISEGIDAFVPSLKTVSKDGLIWAMNREANWHNYGLDYNQSWATLSDNVTKIWPNNIVNSKSFSYEFKDANSNIELAFKRVYYNNKGKVEDTKCGPSEQVNLDFLPSYDDDAVSAWHLTKPADHPDGWNFGLMGSDMLSRNAKRGGISAVISEGTSAFLTLSDWNTTAELSKDTNYGFVFEVNGTWKIVEGGVPVNNTDYRNRKPYGTYNAGDMFIVSRSGDSYIFRQRKVNGKETHNVYFMKGKSEAKYLAASIYNAGGSLQNVRASFDNDFSGIREHSVAELQKRPNAKLGWNYGFQSKQYAKASEDAKVRARVVKDTFSAIFGLENKNKGLHKGKQISYGFRFLSAGTWTIYVNGKPSSIKGTYEVGDEFRVERQGQTYIFKKGSTVVHSLTDSALTPLKLHAAIYSVTGGFDKLFASFADGQLLPLAGSNATNRTRVPRRINIDGLYVFKNGDIAFSLAQDYQMGMLHYQGCSDCFRMKNGDIFRYHNSGPLVGKISRILSEEGTSHAPPGYEDNIDALHINETSNGLIDSILLSYSQDVYVRQPGTSPSRYIDGDIIKLTPVAKPSPNDPTVEWSNELYLPESSYLAQGSKEGANEDINAISVHDGKLLISTNSTTELDTDNFEGNDIEDNDGGLSLSHDMRFSDGAAIYITRENAYSAIDDISVFTEQGELFSSGSKTNRYHSDIGAMHAYSCKGMPLPLIDTSHQKVSSDFKVSGTQFHVYEARNGSIYLKDVDSNEVFLFAKGRDEGLFSLSSMPELNNSKAILKKDYIVKIIDKDGDGNLDLLVLGGTPQRRMLTVFNYRGATPKVLFSREKSIVFIMTDILGSPIGELPEKID